MLSTYYVYFHINPITNKVFYVGKGKDKRGYSTRGRNIHWKRTVQKYGGFIVDITDKDLTDTQACEKEIFYINSFGLKNLTNMVAGGTGGDTISNHPERQRIIEKQSEYSKGKNNPNYGGKFKCDEWIEKQIASNSKKPLLVFDTQTGETLTYRNSKDVATALNVNAGQVRICKINNWKLKRRYIITDK